MDDKFWIRVHFNNGTDWIPKLSEWGKIGSGIYKCEDRKYPPPLEGGKMVKRFMDECYDKTKEDIDEIFLKYDPNGKTKEKKERFKALDDIANKGWNL